jgi:hypothetical protein
VAPKVAAIVGSTVATGDPVAPKLTVLVESRFSSNVAAGDSGTVPLTGMAALFSSVVVIGGSVGTRLVGMAGLTFSSIVAGGRSVAANVGSGMSEVVAIGVSGALRDGVSEGSTSANTSPART